MPDNEQEISVKDYLELLAAKIVAENKNTVTEAVANGFKEHREEHERFLREEFKPLAVKVGKLRRFQIYKDSALASSVLMHGKNLMDFLKHYGLL